MDTPAPPSADDLRASLRGVIDPELGSDIVDLGMVRHVEVDAGGAVEVTIVLTTAGCPLRAQIQKDVKNRLRSLRGVTSVHIDWAEMTNEERTLAMDRARFNISQRQEATSVGPTTRVITIASGKGGVGKSSVTVNLAAALANRGMKVGVLDADIWGFSVPRMLGVPGRLAATKAADGKSRIVPNEKHIGAGLLKIVSTGNLVDDEGTALMWRGLMLTKAVEQFPRDVAWGHLDYLLIDMPPGTGDVQMGLARMLPRTDLIIVTTPAVSAQKVAIRAADMARRSFLRVAGVIENMSAFTCDHGERYTLFGSGGGQALADEIGVELLGQVPLEPAVAAGGDAGVPVVLDGDGPAAAVFRSIAAQLATEIAPTVNMAGCSARLLDSVEKALGPAV
jgi:ATP-binding protein involved in chromosome partitioning